MTRKINIVNSSNAINIKLSLISIDEKNTYLNNHVLIPGETITSIVEEGVEKMTIYGEGTKVIWEGIIPSCEKHSIFIEPEYGNVKYGERYLVNTLVKSSFDWRIIIVLLILICIIILYLK